jgi:hypothetical protein
MATTTPNFGWTVPTSTDLVKDGAVAIETLGDSIDSSLAKVSINTQTTSTYTIVLADALNQIIITDSGSANAIKIPTDASVNFPIGSVINLFVKGAGTTTISAVTSGTTSVVSGGVVSAQPTVLQNKSCTCIKIGANSWIVVGSIG